MLSNLKLLEWWNRLDGIILTHAPLSSVAVCPSQASSRGNDDDGDDDDVEAGSRGYSCYKHTAAVIAP